MSIKIASTALLSAIAFFCATNSNAATVQQIVWNPDAVANGTDVPATDFIAKTSYTQWFQAAGTENTFGPRQTIDVSNLAALVGTNLTGTGIFTEFNAVNTQNGDPNPETTPADFTLGSTQLTYAFGGILVTSVSPGGVFAVDYSNAWVNFYSDTTANYGNSLPETVDAIDTIYGTPFLSLSIDYLNLQTALVGQTLFGSVDAFFSVTGGAAAGYFNTNQMNNGLSDFSYSSSTNFANLSNFTSGTAELRGDSVNIPEPATLSLLGLGLFGVGVAKRRRIG